MWSENFYSQCLLGLLLVVPLLWLFSLRPDQGVYSSFERVNGNSLFKYFVSPPVHELVAEGYEKIIKPSHKPFVVRWWAKDYLILPPRYLSGLRGGYSQKLSFFANLSDAFFLHCAAGDLYQSDRMIEVVRRGVNAHLPTLTTDIMPSEVDRALEQEICQDGSWHSLPAAQTLMNVTHRTATRVLVSAESARDERFIHESMAFVTSIFINALIIVKLPLGIFRPLLSHPISLYQQYRLRRAVRLLQPQVAKRMAERAAGVEKSDRLDAIEWTLECSSANPRHNTPRRVAEELLYGLWAGSSAPGGVVTDLLFLCLLTPDYLVALRDEADSVLLRTHGRWTEQTFGTLRKLDSFIRETNRVYPTGSVSAARTVKGQDAFRFADGLSLPPGTRFGFPIKAIQSDPDTLTESQQFNGFRFAQMRDDGPDDHSQMASTVDTTNLAFGYGNHACPGRFFAIREIKIIFVKLIQNYEFKWAGEVTGRPRPILIEGQFIPNMKQRILFRRRTTMD